MTRDETRPFAIGEPCAQNKEGELLWSFDAIAQAVSDAIFAEREACAAICDEHRSHARIGVPWIAACAASIRARGQQ